MPAMSSKSPASTEMFTSHRLTQARGMDQSRRMLVRGTTYSAAAIIASVDQPQNTVFVCTGRNRPYDNHETWSMSGVANLMLRYSPIRVPQMSQNVAVAAYE